MAGLVTAALGFRWRMPAMRWTSLLLWAAPAVGGLLVTTGYRLVDWPPVSNFRFLAFVVMVVTGAALTALYRDKRGDLTADEAEILRPQLFGVASAILALWVLTAETFHVFRWYQMPSRDAWEYAAHLGVSVAWTLYAAGWLVYGIARRQGLTRWLSLCLFGLALAKVFLWDLRFLTLPFRMVSFAVLGLILIAVAWLYSRYGAVLRDRRRPEESAPPPEC